MYIFIYLFIIFRQHLYATGMFSDFTHTHTHHTYTCGYKMDTLHYSGYMFNEVHGLIMVK